MARSSARAAVMQLIFEHISGGEGGEESLQMVYDELREETAGTERPVRSDEPLESDRAWIDRVYAGVLEHLDDIDARISGASRGWSIDRMPHVDLTILRIAVWEILYDEANVPGPVAINEAIELANRYSDPEKSSRFINGILGTVYRSREAAE